mmetsp:Transcript_25715/g.80136  ORF Transcript_25715/g.80136 Transcript_25715/m.80136 type:complete len:113 (+) Transcript_25715:373-711(+)
MEEKAYVIEGTATLTADDEALHGPPVTITAKDMVTFPKGWTGRWDVDCYLKKRYAFFDADGLRVDEDESDDDASADGGKRKAEDEAAEEEQVKKARPDEAPEEAPPDDAVGE